MDKIKAIFYARVSTEEEEQLNAIEKQIQENVDIIKKNKWKLVDRYIDRGISGTQTKRRNDYNRLLSDIPTDKFDIIVVKDQSRLQRNTLDWYMFLNTVIQNDKQIFFYLENKFFSPDDKFLYGIKAMMAEEYSRDLSKKSNNAVKRRHMQGKPIVTNRTWGYTNTKGVIGIDENEAPIVKKIFQLFADGCGGRIVARLLREQGVRNRNGKTLSENTIRDIVKNPLFMGIAVMNKEHYNFESKMFVKNPEEEWIYAEGAVPPIVDKELWYKANNKLNGRKNVDRRNNINTGRNQGSHMLSSKIVCGECGSLYWRNKRKEAIYWYCSEGSKSGKVRDNTGDKCAALNLKEDEIFDLLDDISMYIWSDAKMDQVMNKVLDKVADVLSSGEKTIDYTEKITILENRKSKLVDSFLDGVVTKEIYNEKLSEITSEIKLLIDKKDNANSSKRNREELIEKMVKVKELMKEGKERKISTPLMTSHLEKLHVFENRLDMYFDFYNDLKYWVSSCEKNGKTVKHSMPICVGGVVSGGCEKDIGSRP